MTKILLEYPPVFERVERAFNLNGKKPIFAYGGVIYNPFGGIIDDYMIVHEEVHFNQQEKYGVDLWWEYYITDVKFRFDQEVEAYRAQWMAVCDHNKDRNFIYRYLHMMACELAGPLYGNIISVDDAKKTIKNV